MKAEVKFDDKIKGLEDNTSNNLPIEVNFIAESSEDVKTLSSMSAQFSAREMVADDRYQVFSDLDRPLHHPELRVLLLTRAKNIPSRSF